MTLKFYSPDAPTGSEPVTEEKTKNQKASVPAADIDFGNLALIVSTAWAANSQITLIGKTTEDFAQQVTDYNTVLNNRRQQGSLKPQQTKTLKTLDRQAATALAEVKSYISNKYTTKNAQSYYPQFGIVHQGKKWVLPFDRQEKSQALQMMIDAIAEHGFGENVYGTTFWTTLKSQYDVALSTTSAIKQGVSNKVGNKNQLKTEIKKVLKSLRLTIEANYPDTFKQVLREWGFLKEDY
jgi:hypothetical protein